MAKRFPILISSILLLRVCFFFFNFFVATCVSNMVLITPNRWALIGFLRLVKYLIALSPPQARGSKLIRNLLGLSG